MKKGHVTGKKRERPHTKEQQRLAALGAALAQQRQHLPLAQLLQLAGISK